MKLVLEYKEFISEKLLLESLIIESNVIYSTKFKNILSKMKDNRIAKSLLEIENPKIPTLDEVAAWARHIAYCQFTEVEMRDGTAWRILNDH